MSSTSFSSLIDPLMLLLQHTIIAATAPASVDYPRYSVLLLLQHLLQCPPVLLLLHCLLSQPRSRLQAVSAVHPVAVSSAPTATTYDEQHQIINDMKAGLIVSHIIRLSPLLTTASLISIDRHYLLLLVRVSIHHHYLLLLVRVSIYHQYLLLLVQRSSVIAFYCLNHTVKATAVLGVMMLTYDHDGNYNITIISNNSDDGDHFQGRHQHHHQHHHQHNHFSAFTSSPTTDVSSLPTTVTYYCHPSSYNASSSSYDATPRKGRVFSACLSIIRSTMSVVHVHHNNFCYSDYWSHGCSFYHL